MTTVVHENTVVSGLTFKTRDITHAEEVAIVLAAVDQIRVIINDSRGACKNIERGYIPYYAYKILQDSSYTGAPTLV